MRWIMQKKIGMNPNEEVMTNFDTKLLQKLFDERKENEEQEYISEDEHDFNLDFNIIEQLFGIQPGTLTTNTGSDSNINPSGNENLHLDLEENQSSESEFSPGVSEKSGFIEVINPDGTKTNMRKSTLVWKLLENNGYKLSSDRNKRVQGPSEPKRKKQKTSIDFNAPNENPILFKSANIQIGEWAVFQINAESGINFQNSEQFLKKNCLLGIILGFKNVKEKGQVVQHKSRYAKIASNEEQNLNLHVLGIWYVCNQNRTLTPIENKKKIEMNIQNYIGTMKTVDKKNKTSSENSKHSYEIPCEFSELATLIFKIRKS